MDHRTRQAQTATWIGILVNLVLSLIKGAVGWISGSKALLADAAHSASDVVSSIAVLAGIRAAQKAADKEHPYGHGKAEHVSAIVVAVLLGVVGVEIALASFKSLREGPVAPAAIALWAVLLSIAVKEALYQYKVRLGRKLKSQALIADAWHHRSDAFSSVGALLGIAGAIAGDAFSIPWMIYLDPLAGMVVSLFLMQVGYKIVQESINVVLETVLGDDECQRFALTIRQVDGVKSIDVLRARTHGHYVIIDLKTGVDPDLTVEAGHRVAKAVKQALMTDHEDVRDVLIHINPVSRQA